MTSPLLLNVAESPRHEGPGPFALSQVQTGDKVQLVAHTGVPFWVEVSRIVTHGPYNPSLGIRPPATLEGVVEQETSPGGALRGGMSIQFDAQNIIAIA